MIEGMTSTAPVHPTAEAIARVLNDAGYTVQTTIAPYRGGHLVWITGPAGTAGFHGTYTVGARSGRVTGATLYPLGEDAVRHDVRGADVYTAVCDALTGINLRISATQRHTETGAVLAGRDAPTLADSEAAALAA